MHTEGGEGEKRCFHLLNICTRRYHRIPDETDKFAGDLWSVIFNCAKCADSPVPRGGGIWGCSGCLPTSPDVMMAGISITMENCVNHKRLEKKTGVFIVQF